MKLQKYRLKRPEASAGMGGLTPDEIPQEEMVIALPEGVTPPTGAEAVPPNTNTHSWRPVEKRGPDAAG